MITRRSRGSPLVLILFALPFAGVGLFMGGLTVRTLHRAQAMEHWMEVPVVVHETALVESRGDDSTTYRVTARYSYQVDGRTYEGTRVGLQGGSDNIGDWHQQRYRELLAARDGQRQLTGRVNPAQPADAILFPKVRTGMVMFYLAFALVFGGAGLGMVVAGLRAWRRRNDAAAAPPEEPWRARQDWAEGLITSTSRAEAWGLTIMAVIWNAIAWTMLALMGGEMLQRGGMALLFLLFPLVGLGLAAAAVRFQLVARRYGRAVFQMASVPGVLGGAAGGINPAARGGASARWLRGHGAMPAYHAQREEYPHHGGVAGRAPHQSGGAAPGGCGAGDSGPVRVALYIALQRGVGSGGQHRLEAGGEGTPARGGCGGEFYHPGIPHPRQPAGLRIGREAHCGF